MKRAIVILVLIIIWTYTFAQKAGSYHIQAIEINNRFLTIDDDKNLEDDFAWIAPSNNSGAQIFTLEPAEGDFFYLKCSNGLYVTIQAGHLTNESTLQILPKENRDHFKWMFRESADGYVIESKAKSFIEISTPFGQNEAFVVTKQFMNGQIRQKWKLKPVAQLYSQPVVAVFPPTVIHTALEQKTYEVSAQIGHIEHTKHNNDCRRLQGKIIIDILSSNNDCCDRIIKPRINDRSTLLDWSGDKKTDFRVRNIPDDQPMTDEPLFEVPKSLMENGSLFMKLTSDIKGCHKSGDTAWDYNCYIDYSGVFKFDLRQFKKRVGQEGAVFLEGELPIRAKKNGKADIHVLTLYITLFYNKEK